jgi:hypothetical protein
VTRSFQATKGHAVGVVGVVGTQARAVAFDARPGF